MVPPSQFPLRYDLEVPPDGRIEVQLPLPVTSPVTIYVVEHADADSHELLAVAESSIGFWDNSEDDEDWNDA